MKEFISRFVCGMQRKDVWGGKIPLPVCGTLLWVKGEISFVSLHRRGVAALRMYGEWLMREYFPIRGRECLRWQWGREIRE